MPEQRNESRAAKPDLTPAQEKSLAEIARKFQGDMKKLGLGVSMKAGDGPWIKITDPPEEDE